MNSLIIAADASRARLYRTAHPNDVESPVELVEVDAVDRVNARAVQATTELQCDELRAFARRIAERAAKFAQYHFCNPLIVSATADTYPALRDELARELPHVYMRSVIGDTAQLPARELMNALSEREMFKPVNYPHQA